MHARKDIRCRGRLNVLAPQEIYSTAILDQDASILAEKLMKEKLDVEEINSGDQEIKAND